MPLPSGDGPHHAGSGHEKELLRRSTVMPWGSCSKNCGKLPVKLLFANNRCCRAPPCGQFGIDPESRL